MEAGEHIYPFFIYTAYPLLVAGKLRERVVLHPGLVAILSQGSNDFLPIG